MAGVQFTLWTTLGAPTGPLEVSTYISKLHYSTSGARQYLLAVILNGLALLKMASTSSLHFFAHQVGPASEDVFLKRIQDITERLNKRGCSWPAPFLSLSNSKIKEAAIGPSHIAFLLQDGRVCRTTYNVYADLLHFGAVKDEPKSSGSSKAATPAPGGSSSSQVRSSETNASASPNKAKVRRVAVMTTSGRGAARGARGVIVGGRPLVPASAVPEDLIAQAQVVLQGKSREVIVRELQRTSLDVNLAVNNLLSRDDDDGDEYDDGADSFLPEELISLLDGGLADHPNVIIDADSFYSDEVFGYSTIRRRVNERAAERHEAEKESQSSSQRTAQPSAGLCPIIPSSLIEFWDEKCPIAPKFEHIAAMYSELVAIGADGKLYQWAWASELPYQKDGKTEPEFHPRHGKLCLSGEKIVEVNSSLIRTVILTQSNKVASFIDESLGPGICSLLDMLCTEVPEPVTIIHTCPLYSCARVRSGHIYWWGAMPFSLRKRLWDKARAKVKKHVTFDSAEISVGCQVRMRSNPLYQVGSVGFCLTGSGEPAIGILMEAVWSLSEVCRFKIIDSSQLKLSGEEASDDKNADMESTEFQLPSASALDNASSKRQIGAALDDAGPNSVKEEAWNLKDVFFVEEAKVQSTGTVIMVDGAYCAVLFPDRDGKITEDPKATLKSCRLLRKDELQVLKLGQSSKSPECIQKELKKLTIHQKGQVLDLAVDPQGIKLLLQKQQHISLCSVSLTGKTEQDCAFPTTSSAFIGSGASKPRIINYGEESLCFVTDGNGCLYPIAKDSAGGIRDPQSFYLPPLAAFGVGLHPLKASAPSRTKGRLVVGLLLLKAQPLLDSVLHCDIDSAKYFVRSLEKERNLDKAHKEIVERRLENNCNVVHACVAMCLPPNNKDALDLDASETSGTITLLNDSSSASGTSKGPSIRSFYDTKHWEDLIAPTLRRFESSRNVSAGQSSSSNAAAGYISWSSNSALPPGPPVAESNRAIKPAPSVPPDAALDVVVPIISWPPETSETNFGDDEVCNIPLPPASVVSKPVSDVKQRQLNAFSILRFLCESPFMTGYLIDLLSEKDGYGRTPFIYAISRRAYSAAILLFDAAVRLGRATSQYKEVLQDMLYPETSESPLMTLCSNDTCSFTWTGSEHINQDIFECKTCGLVGSLCCCSECANVCHKGHECRLKKTSPTAYCDCWEKCKCKSLIAGDQNARFGLLNRLLTETDLVGRPNKKGEHILLYLVKTVGRQVVEQRQYKPGRSRTQNKAADVGSDLDVPESDLEPPKFARKALERLLKDWTAVKSLLWSGCKTVNKSAVVFEDSFYLNSQAGSMHLDRFTYTLLSKCSSEVLDIMLTTLVREVQNPANAVEATSMACRFVRSATRVFLVANSTISAGSCKKRRIGDRSDPIMKCRRVFQVLVTFALVELAEAADAILAPLRLGLLKPCAQFSLGSSYFDSAESCEKVFSTDPFFPLTSSTAPTRLSEKVSDVGAGRRRRERASDSEMLDQASSDSDTESERSGPPNAPREAESSVDAEIMAPVASSSSTAQFSPATTDRQQRVTRRGGVAAVAASGLHASQALSSSRRLSRSGTQSRIRTSSGTSAASPSRRPGNTATQQEGGDQNTAPLSQPTSATLAASQPESMDATGSASQAMESDTGYSDTSPLYENEDEQSGIDDDDDHDASFHYSYSEEDIVDGSADDDDSVDSPPESDAEEDEADARDDDNDDSRDYESAADFFSNMFETEAGTEAGRSRRVADGEGHISSTPASLGWALRGRPNPSVREPPIAQTSSGGSSGTDRERMRIVPSTTSTTTSTTNSATSAMASSSHPSERGLIFLDSGSLRRSASMSLANAVAANDASQSANTSSKQDNVPSVSVTAQLIAKTFGVIVRQITDMLAIAREYKALAPALPHVLSLSTEEVKRIETFVCDRLKPSWDWLFTVLDSLEAQLRFGSALTAATDPSHPAHPLNPTLLFTAGTSQPTGSHNAGEQSAAVNANSSVVTAATATGGGASGVGTRLTSFDPRRVMSRIILGATTFESVDSQNSNSKREFLHYLLSLLRSQSHEHADELPVLEIAAMKHIAFVADALLYYVQCGERSEAQTGFSYSMAVEEDIPKNVDMAATDVSLLSANHPFFKRSESIIFPGILEPVEPFAQSVEECLPLAERPYLLQPDSTKEKLFGAEPKPVSVSEHKMIASMRGNKNPTNLSLSTRSEFSWSENGSVPLKESESLPIAAESASASSLKSPKQVIWRPTMDDTESSAFNVAVPSSSSSDKGPRLQSVIVHSSLISRGGENVSDETRKCSSEPMDLSESATEQTEVIPGKYPMPTKMDSLWLGKTNYLMGRWQLTLLMLAKVFTDDVLQEPGSVLVQLAGYPLKESRFRKEMEKFRNQQGKDLVLEVDRERHLLIQQTIKQLNQHFSRRSAVTAGCPMAVHKVKVAFKDEPGEGSGVARSFYSAIAEALLAPDRLPNLEHSLVGSMQNRTQNQLLNRLRTRERERELHRRQRSGVRRYGYQLNTNALSFVPSSRLSDQDRDTQGSLLDASKQGLGDRLYLKIRAMRPSLAAKITGMLLELPMHQVIVLLTSDESLRSHVEEATDLIFNASEPGTTGVAESEANEGNSRITLSGGYSAAGSDEQKTTRRTISTPNLGGLDPDDLVDNAPLFFQSANNGFFSPNPGKGSNERLNAFRNVGRMLGISLLQNEVIPLPLCRHVLKYILGRHITWYDLAFYDPALFENLRAVVQSNADVAELHLTFSITLGSEEGGGTVDLKPNGSDIPVTSENLLEYVYLYVECRLVKVAEKALEAMKLGFFDVLPVNSIEYLNAEDLRLLLNGLSEVKIKLLQTYTSFADESNAPTEHLATFKKWFWSVLEAMTPEEKQDLVYFWTGSPSLPSSEDGFQPLPSVLIRPADDQHLPTANTCISRLYVPLYSSKTILKQKLCLAIKARNFGFV